MWPIFPAHVAQFFSTYMALDAVIGDLDSPKELPKTMQWTAGLPEQVFKDFNDLNSDPDFKVWFKAKDNIGYWKYSKEYKRDVFKTVVDCPAPISTVVDRLWLGGISGLEKVPGANDDIASVKILNYAGRNAVVYLQKVILPLSSFILSPRSLLEFKFVIEGPVSETAASRPFTETQHRDSSSIVVNNGEENGTFSEQSGSSCGRTFFIIGTNTSMSTEKYPANSENVRMLAGPQGFKLTELCHPQSGQPWTRTEFLVNVDLKLNFVPQSVIRKLMTPIVRKKVMALREFFTSKK